MIWVLIWAVLAVYGVAGLMLILAVGGRWLWELLPPNPEVVARQRRMEHDQEMVRLGKVPGVF